MKPSPFAYARPRSVEEALAALAEAGPGGKVLAGGQSLLPILSMRLAAPATLVDVGALTDLAYVRTDDDGVRVGALARHRTLERDDAAAAAVPLLREAVSLVAHPTIRTRGTTVGSLAHADPSGEMTAVLALLGGSVTLASTSGTRTLAAADFFVGPLESACATGELAVEAFFPRPAAGTGTAFVEVARRHGDYAVCGVAAAVTRSGDAVTSARVAYLSMGPVPAVADVTPAAPSTPGGDWSAAADLAVASTDPEADIHATAAYRRHLGRVLAARALARAAGRAGAEAVAA